MLVALLFAGAVSAVFQAAAQAFLFARNAQGGTDWVDVLGETLAGADLVVALFLLGAYALVVFGPGARIGRLGSRLLYLVQWIGITLTLMAGGAAEEILRLSERVSGSPGFGTAELNPSVAGRWISKIGLVSPYLVVAAITGFVAWSALQALNDGLADPPPAGD